MEMAFDLFSDCNQLDTDQSELTPKQWEEKKKKQL